MIAMPPDSPKDRFFTGRSFLFVEHTPSTNTLVMEDLKLLGSPGLVVYAGRQEAGRGRMGRRWHSGIEGNLYASLVIHPRLPIALIPAMTILTGLAVFDTLNGYRLDGLSIKWPNDILIHDRKVCGILCESRAMNNGRYAVVAGVGINVKGRPEEFPEQIRHRATTLEAEGVKTDREKILESLVTHLDRILIQAHREGPERIFRRWERASSSLGRTVTFEMDGRPARGRIRGLDNRGRLLVTLPDGKTHPVVTGEVFYEKLPENQRATQPCGGQ